MWSQGSINGYDYWVKHYDDGSHYGINGDGRISKLSIRKGHTEIYHYDRGLDFDDLDADGKTVYDMILEQFN